MSSSVVIEIENFSKAYQNELAVEDVSFSVSSGQILGLIGPNGAGKTTTLRALAGIIPASAGRLAVNGFNVDQDPVGLKSCTAYVPDDPQLFNDLTVQQHFAFVAGVYQLNDWQERMLTILRRFELESRRSTRASDLSRGMRQKLALGCAYLYQPTALLLDEPMTGLDPKGIRVLKETIAEQAALGRAVVISSHLLAMVEDICTHVLILEDGRSKFFGCFEEMKSEFATQQSSNSLEEFFFQAVAR